MKQKKNYIIRNIIVFVSAFVMVLPMLFLAGCDNIMQFQQASNKQVVEAEIINGRADTKLIIENTNISLDDFLSGGLIVYEENISDDIVHKFMFPTIEYFDGSEWIYIGMREGYARALVGREALLPGEKHRIFDDFPIEGYDFDFIPGQYRIIIYKGDVRSGIVHYSMYEGHFTEFTIS